MMRDIGICSIVCALQILLTSARTVIALSHRVVMDILIKYHGHGVIHLTTRWSFKWSSKAWVLLYKIFEIKLILISKRASLLLTTIQAHCSIGKINGSSSKQCYPTLIDGWETCVDWSNWIHSRPTHLTRIDNLNLNFNSFILHDAYACLPMDLIAFYLEHNLRQDFCNCQAIPR